MSQSAKGSHHIGRRRAGDQVKHSKSSHVSSGREKRKWSKLTEIWHFKSLLRLSPLPETD